VSRMRDERRDDEKSVLAAEAALADLIGAVHREAQAKSLGELQGSAFTEVLRRRCPLWPFC
jgi:hypothetical protein